MALRTSFGRAPIFPYVALRRRTSRLAGALPALARGFARVLDLPFNRQELTINVRAAGDLYTKLIDATEGYAGDVPIIHQAVAVKAAIDALDTSFQEDRDANF